MIEIYPCPIYKSYFDCEKERTNQIILNEDGNLNNTELIFTINKIIFQILHNDEIYSDQERIFLCINRILNLITQKYPFCINFLSDIWNRNFGKLLIDFIENNNLLNQLSTTLNLILFLLKSSDAKLFFSNYKLKNVIFRILTSFPSETILINQSIMILSSILPFYNENIELYIPNIFFKMAPFYDFENCELSLCTLVHKIVQTIDISRFYEPITELFKKILTRKNFSTQTLILILKTISKLQIRNKKYSNEYLNNAIDNIIIIVSGQIENFPIQLIIEFLKFTKNTLLYSEKSKIYKLLRKTSFLSLVRLYQTQENPKIVTMILGIITEVLKIERGASFFCQFDLAIKFNENLLLKVIHNFSKKSFVEKQAILRLLVVLTCFQNPETFKILKVKNKFVFDKLIHFAFNSQDNVIIKDCLDFLLNYFEMSLMFENFSSFSLISEFGFQGPCSFVSNYNNFHVDQFVDELSTQYYDYDISNQAKKLQFLVKRISSCF